MNIDLVGAKIIILVNRPNEAPLNQGDICTVLSMDKSGDLKVVSEKDGSNHWFLDGRERGVIFAPYAPEFATSDLDVVLGAIKAELSVAMANWPAMNSAHEGYGVLLEEVDELWDHVKTKQKNRDLEKMKKEAVQVAAMAIRFAIEVCNEERGRK